MFHVGSPFDVSAYTHFRFPLREDVEECNTRRLAALKGPKQRYKSRDNPGHDENGHPISGPKYINVLKRMTVSEIIHLKVCLSDI